MKSVNVLESEYTIEITKKSDDKCLEYNDGYCDASIRKIVCADIAEMAKKDIMVQTDTQRCTKQIIRHELIHAFLYESGLAHESSWATNEEMVDWFALQFPKLQKAFESIDVMG